MCDGETHEVGKLSWFGEPSESIIKLDLLSFRILAQVEVMASRLCGILIKSFDFIFWPSSALRSSKTIVVVVVVVVLFVSKHKKTNIKICYHLPHLSPPQFGSQVQVKQSGLWVP